MHTSSDNSISHSHMLDDWMQKRHYGLKPNRKGQMGITIEHVDAAIRHSNKSSLGPDGNPYAAWRHAGRSATRRVRTFRNTQLPEGFNDRFL